MGSMKSSPIRRTCKSKEELKGTDKMSFEYMICDDIKDMETSVMEMLSDRTVKSKEVLEMILDLASRKYSCIIRGEEV